MKGISVYKISKDLKINKQSIANYIDKNNIPSVETANIIANYLGTSLEYLLSGQGSPFKADEAIQTSYGMVSEPTEPYLTTKSGIKYHKLPNGKFIMSVPFVPIKAYAKYVDECRDAEHDTSEEVYNFMVEQVGHGNYMAFEIKGDSMDDDSKRSLCNGDIVLGRELSCEHWKSKLHTNEYPNWIIVMDNTILCKQIVKHNVSKGAITCHSLNPSPEYSDFELNLNNVRQMFNIIQRVSKM